MTPSRSRFLEIRGLQLHLREWGRPESPRLFLLHGWMDHSASFQFIVDALASEWHVIAPDWRGFGLSARAPQGYWFPDYLADLEAIIEAVQSDDAPLVLAGHSMGGNIAALYAGIRPRRVAQLVLLDAFGLADRPPEEAPGRYEKWLNELARPQGFRSYDSVDAYAARLRQDNPRLSAEQADFLAASSVRPDGAGRYESHGDPAHRIVNPVLYRRAEAMACWRRVQAPVLSLVPAGTGLRRLLGVEDDAHRAGQACFGDFREVVIGDAGHNLHHDQPGRVAALLEAFVLRGEIEVVA
ncbi:MAG: alpha/beta hydrolase [Rhodocyclaceae bacterium]|nr:alpha/beta hydrolase [Rhodocyclaceae bacterium]